MSRYLDRLIRAARDLAEYDRMIADGRSNVDWSRCTDSVTVHEPDGGGEMDLSCFQQRDRDGEQLTEYFLRETPAPTICAECEENRNIFKRIRELKAKRELAVKRVIRNARHVPEPAP